MQLGGVAAACHHDVQTSFASRLCKHDHISHTQQPTIRDNMEEALRASAAASRRDLSSMSMRQLADSIPVRDEEDRKPSTKLGRSTYDTSSSAGLETVPIHTSKASGGPVTMSLPAILRQNVPGYKARSARMSQLQPSARASTSDKQESSHEKARQKLSRRKLRRWENGRFALLR